MTAKKQATSKSVVTTTPSKSDITKSILSVGRSLKLGFGKAKKLHPVVIAAIGTRKGDSYRKMTSKQWTQVFHDEFIKTAGLKWPCNDKGELISYKTLMNKPEKHPVSLIDAAHYFNNLQSNLYSKKLIQSVKQTGKGRKSSAATVVDNDAILSRFQAILELTQSLDGAKKSRAEKHLANCAKVFGFSNISLPAK